MTIGDLLSDGITAAPADDEVVLMIPIAESETERPGVVLSRDEALDAAQDIIDAVDDTIPDNTEDLARVAEEASQAAKELSEEDAGSDE